MESLMKTSLSLYVTDEFFLSLIKLALYPSEFSIGVSDKESFSNWVINFTKELKNQCSKHRIGIKVDSKCNLVAELFRIREESPSLLDPKSLKEHLTTRDPIAIRLLDKAVEHRLTQEEFQDLYNRVVANIKLFYAMLKIQPSLNAIDRLLSNAINTDTTPVNFLVDYRDTISRAFTDLNKLRSVLKEEELADYFVVTDERSCEKLSENILTYLSSGYNTYKTGIKLFDEYIEGFESSSIHIISAPSNHGKSLFLVNLCYNILKYNNDRFQKGDAVLFLTLEDDIYKLLKRVIPVFGNYQVDTVRETWRAVYDVLSNQVKSPVAQDDTTLERFKKIYKDLLTKSITSVTNGSVHLVIKHVNENTFSPGDLARFIDSLKISGYNVRIVFLDYIDCMVPELSTKSLYSADDYVAQGQIVQELRILARSYKIPIITATQNNRASENIKIEMNNTLVGDSYKKVRLADFWYMVRMREDLAIDQEPVASYLIPSYKSNINTNFDFTNDPEMDPNIKQFIQHESTRLVPFEIKLTKSKDSVKNVSTFALFFRGNLRIYDDINKLYSEDYQKMNENSKHLHNEIYKLSKSSFLASDLSNIVGNLTSTDSGKFSLIH